MSTVFIKLTPKYKEKQLFINTFYHYLHHNVINLMSLVCFHQTFQTVRWPLKQHQKDIKKNHDTMVRQIFLSKMAQNSMPHHVPERNERSPHCQADLTLFTPYQTWLVSSFWVWLPLSFGFSDSRIFCVLLLLLFVVLKFLPIHQSFLLYLHLKKLLFPQFFTFVSYYSNFSYSTNSITSYNVSYHLMRQANECAQPRTHAWVPDS